jgi:hypothetical protein
MIPLLSVPPLHVFSASPGRLHAPVSAVAVYFPSHQQPPVSPHRFFSILGLLSARVSLLASVSGAAVHCRYTGRRPKLFGTIGDVHRLGTRFDPRLSIATILYWFPAPFESSLFDLSPFLISSSSALSFQINHFDQH